MQLSSQFIGNIAMIFYVLVTALSSILIHTTNQNISPFLSAFYTFLFCALVYNLMTIKSYHYYSKVKKWWLEILMLNITTAICWIGAFISLKYIPPELFLFIYLCSMPIASGCIYKKNIFKTIFLFFGLIALTVTYHGKGIVLGSGLAFIGGIFGTVYSIYSKKISSDFSTCQILSFRFHLIVIITFLMNIVSGEAFIFPIVFYGQYALLSLISVILPITLFQIGLKHLELPSTLLFLPFAPILCYLLSCFRSGGQFHNDQIMVIILLTLVLLSPKFIFKMLKKQVNITSSKSLT